MVVPPLADNASTLASLRMVSYVEGFQFMYTAFSPFTFLFQFSNTSKTPLPPLYPGEVNKDSTKTIVFSHYMGLLT